MATVTQQREMTPAQMLDDAVAQAKAKQSPEERMADYGAWYIDSLAADRDDVFLKKQSERLFGVEMPEDRLKKDRSVFNKARQFVDMYSKGEHVTEKGDEFLTSIPKEQQDEFLRALQAVGTKQDVDTVGLSRVSRRLTRGAQQVGTSTAKFMDQFGLLPEHKGKSAEEVIDFSRNVQGALAGMDPAKAESWLGEAGLKAAEMFPAMAVSTLGGMKGIGQRAGNWAFWTAQTQPQQEWLMEEHNVDPETAKLWSWIGGMASAAVEQLGSAQLRGVKPSNPTLRNFVKENLIEWGAKEWLGEEGSQAMIELAADAIARKTGGGDPMDWDKEFHDKLTELMETGAPLAILMGPGAAVRGVQTYGEGKARQQRFSDIQDERALRSQERTARQDSALTDEEASRLLDTFAKEATEPPTTQRTETESQGRPEDLAKEPGWEETPARPERVREAQQRLTQLEAMMEKGYVAKEEAQQEGIPGENRKERLANAQQEAARLRQEIEDASTVRSPETEVREEQGRQDVRGERQEQVPTEQEGQVPEAREGQVEPVAPADEQQPPGQPAATKPSATVGQPYTFSPEQRAERVEQLARKQFREIHARNPQMARQRAEEVVEQEQNALQEYPVGTKLEIEGYKGSLFEVRPDGTLSELNSRRVMGDNAGAVLRHYTPEQITTITEPEAPAPKRKGRKVPIAPADVGMEGRPIEGEPARANRKGRKDEGEAKPAPQPEVTPEEAGIAVRKTPKGWTVRGIPKEVADGITDDYKGHDTGKGYYFFKEDPTEGLKQAAPALKREAELAAQAQEEGLVATRIGALEPEQAEWYEQQRTERIEAARAPIAERNAAVSELLANIVSPGRRAHFKRKLVKVMNEGGDPDQIPGFDKVVQYAENHPELGLPQDETELLDFLAREPWKARIDDDTLAASVDEELAAELLQFAENDPEIQMEREAIQEEVGDVSFDVETLEGEAEPGARQSAIPGFEDEAASIERSEQARQSRKAFEGGEKKTQRSIFSTSPDVEPDQMFIPGAEEPGTPDSLIGKRPATPTEQPAAPSLTQRISEAVKQLQAKSKSGRMYVKDLRDMLSDVPREQLDQELRRLGSPELNAMKFMNLDDPGKADQAVLDAGYTTASGKKRPLFYAEPSDIEQAAETPAETEAPPAPKPGTKPSSTDYMQQMVDADLVRKEDAPKKTFDRQFRSAMPNNRWLSLPEIAARFRNETEARGWAKSKIGPMVEAGLLDRMYRSDGTPVYAWKGAETERGLLTQAEADQTMPTEAPTETEAPPVQEARTQTASEDEIRAAIQKELASRKKRSRSERTGKEREEARKRFDEKLRKFGRPGTSPIGLDLNKVKEAVDLVEAAAEVAITEFNHFVSRAVEQLGADRVRDLAPYIEAAWDEAGPTPAGKVADVLAQSEDGTPRHPEDLAEAPRPDGYDLTSIKKAVVNDLRALIGLPEMEGSTPQTVEGWAEAARTTMAADPLAAQRLVNQLASDRPRAINQHDAMLLQFRYRQLVNDLEPAVDEYFQAVESGDPAAIATAETAVRNARHAMTEFEEIIHPSKETWGRTGVALQQMARRDFSLEAILRRGQEANHGRPLEPDQVAELTKMAEQLKSLQEQFDKQRQETEELKRELASKKQHDETINADKNRRTKRKSARRVQAEKKVQDAWAEFNKAARGRTGMAAPIELLPPAVKVAKAYADLGLVSIQEFLAHVRKHDPDADEALFRQAWNQIKEEGYVVEPEVSMENLSELTRFARGVQRSLVEAGITERDDVISSVHEAMQDVIPDFTRRQTMDALSRYGQFQMPSQGDIDTRIRNMNAEILKLSQLDQMEKALEKVEQWREEGLTEEEIGNRLAREDMLVKATGLVRDKPTETVRNLTQKYTEMKKSIPFTTEGREGRLQSAQDALIRSLENRIRDVRWELDNAQRIVKERRQTPENADIRRLREELDTLMKAHRQMFPPQKKTLTVEQKLAAADRASERAIAELERQLGEGDIAPKIRVELSSPSLRAQRAYLAQLRAERESLRAERMPELQEQRAKKAYEASLRKRIADYEQILAEGDFAPKPKTEPRTLSDSELKLKRQMEDTRHEVLRKFAEYHLNHLHGIPWVADKIVELSHMSRAIMTGFEMSGLLRQGGLTAMGRPTLAKNALVEIFGSMAHNFDSDAAKALRDGVTLANAKKFLKTIDSRQAEFNLLNQLTSGKEGEFRLRAGLALTSSEEAAVRQEELFQGRWARHIPGVAISGRAYTMTLNKMRADLFDIMVENLGRDGQVTMEDAKSIANFVNVATGRSNLGALNKASTFLNTVFFASRYVASRFQYLAMPFYLPFKGGVKANWRLKRAMYREYARTATGIAAVLGTFHLAGLLFWDDDDDDRPRVGLDPRSSDFLKVRIGETRLDFLAGLSQAFVVSTRLLWPEALGGNRTKSSVTGEVTKLGGEGRYAQTKEDIAKRFARTKLAPVPGAVWTAWLSDMENVVGQKETPGSMLQGLTTPMAYQDIFDAMPARGVPESLAMGPLVFFGIGMHTYGPKTEYVTGTEEERTKQFQTDLNNMEWDSDPPAYSEFLSDEQLKQVYAAQEKAKQKVVRDGVAPMLDRKDYKSPETYISTRMQRTDARRELQEMIQALDLSHAEAQEALVGAYRSISGYGKKQSEFVKGTKGTTREDLKPSYEERAASLAELYGKPKTAWRQWRRQWRESQ